MQETPTFNHQADLVNSAIRFINSWFKQSKSITEELGDFFILPGKKVINKDVIIARLKGVFGQSDEYVGGRYDIIDTNFELFNAGKGMGFVEGVAGFRAVLKKESKIISGPFKLYFALQNGSWKIVNIEFPGFSY
ncbi:hypothetical protein EZJ43_07560 [Pedobacter changchengzhani]|uniref:Nuclear transport factor 2 family protein n=1 Tax=Pedobacter changchengzhani TaxID=2529274 RepID=A0A4R5MML2_9SPHI|nr:hypothetical protein [Pedobacter changchengzhani]TDG36369.1 hypothetical protein EZJ43_07560 [Pedobacter changchengzhani]